MWVPNNDKDLWGRDPPGPGGPGGAQGEDWFVRLQVKFVAHTHRPRTASPASLGRR